MPEIESWRAGGVEHVELQTPILSVAMLGALGSALAQSASPPGPRPIVLSSVHPRIFMAGAHLGEIAELDPLSSNGYAHAGRALLAQIEGHPAPVVAAVHGPCSGGGLDLALSCDAIIAGPAASFSHPGVRRGLITGWGGTRLLPERLGAPAARRQLLQGSELTTSSLRQLQVIAAARGEERSTARAEALRLSCLHPTRTILWRALKRGRFIDRFRIFMIHNVLREAGFERHGNPGQNRSPRPQRGL